MKKQRSASVGWREGAWSLVGYLHMNTSAWRYYIGFYRGYWRTLLVSTVASAGQCLLVLLITILVRHTFDDIIPSGDFRVLLLVGVAILMLNLTNSGISLWTRYLTLKTTKHAIRRLRNDLLHRCYAFSRSFYGEADRGKLHASIVQDTERVDQMSNALVGQLLSALVVSIGLCGVLVWLNWLLFLVMITVVPFLFLVSRSMRRPIRARVNAFHRSFETFSKGILFVLERMDLTRIQTAEQFEIERQEEHLEEVRVTSGSMAWMNAAYDSAHGTLVAVSAILILMVGGMAVATGSMTLGQLLSFYVAMALLRRHVQTVLSSIPYILAGAESLTTLFNIVEVKDSLPYSGRKKIDFSGKITLESVSFRYGDRLVLDDIDLTIYPKSTVAIVGPNGAGKTSIVHLILGFYQPQSGQLYADEHPYAELDMIDLRGHFAVVTQEPAIFAGAIRDNIAYGTPDATLDEVVQASELAMAHEFIQDLPQRYDTPTGENGVLLSGGERQRIAIARALLREPKLLILDEPTNHLDGTTVRRLMHNLKTLKEAPAILMITHDMDLVRDAHCLHVLTEGGRIIASGAPSIVRQDKTLANIYQ